MKKINNFVKIGVSIVLLFAVMAYSSSAAGRFNVPLNWVLGPTGISVDDDNDGVIDAGFVTGSSPWNSSGANIFLNDTTASVGIGTSSPAESLVVIGNVNISGTLHVTGDVRLEWYLLLYRHHQHPSPLLVLHHR